MLDRGEAETDGRDGLWPDLLDVFGPEATVADSGLYWLLKVELESGKGPKFSFDEVCQVGSSFCSFPLTVSLSNQ
jgi:hypothetical protein